MPAAVVKTERDRVLSLYVGSVGAGSYEREEIATIRALCRKTHPCGQKHAR
jgi:hypothetical protein